MHAPVAIWLACCLATTVLVSCKGRAPDWVGQCVQDTRATREFCECLDDRRLLRKGKIVIGSGKHTPSGHYEPPVFKELSVEDKKACRAKMIDQINRDTPLQ